MGRAELQDRGRHRQQRVQIERAGPAAPDQCRGARLPRFHTRPELARQDAAAGDRQVSPRRGLGCGQVEDVLLDDVEIEPPRNDPGSARGRREIRDRVVRPADRQVVVQPDRWYRRCRRRRCARAPPAPFRHRRRPPVRQGRWFAPAPHRCPRDSAGETIRDRAARLGSPSAARRAARSRASCADRDAACGA